MIKAGDMVSLVESCDADNITIATIGSHSALQILKGAKEEGFKTLAICRKGKETAYRRFRVADEIILVNDYREILEENVLASLQKRNSILIPHGSLIAYVGIKGIEESLEIPIAGNRKILRWEADRNMERRWLDEAGIKMPGEAKNPKDISGLSLVKFPGARGGCGYFLVSSYKDYLTKSDDMLKRKKITEHDLKNATIQEYIAGVNMYLSYFHSPLKNEVEFFSIDRRYESNIDGLTRIPASDQVNTLIEPSYVVVGNIPMTARESLLDRVFEMGDDIVKASKKLCQPGMLGAFCLETIVTPKMEFIAFELSARIVAGTNPFTAGSPYSHLLYGSGMSMGRRIALEIKNALREGKEDLLIT